MLCVLQVLLAHSIAAWSELLILTKKDFGRGPVFKVGHVSSLVNFGLKFSFQTK